MKEIYRMQGVRVDREDGEALSDLSLGIRQGEILGVVGEKGAGKMLLKAVLTGQAQVSDGRLYREEEPWRLRRFPPEETLGIDRKSAFCRERSIRENLLGLGGRRALPGRWELARRLAESGIECSQDLPAAKLGRTEQILLWFLLAQIRHVRLICLDTTGSSIGERDWEKIAQAARRLQQEEIATVILDEQETPLFAFCDRIALLSSGRIRKIYYEKQALEEETAEPAGLEEGLFRSGAITGVWDPGMPAEERLPETIARLFAGSGELAGLDFSAERARQGAGVLYIPKDVDECLFDRLGVGANLILAVGRRVGLAGPLVRKSVERFLEGEFYRKFPEIPPCRRVGEWSAQEKKFLAVYRFALLRPRILLLEEPMYRLQRENQEKMLTYLRELAQSGAALVVSAETRAELARLCDRIAVPGRNSVRRPAAGMFTD